MRATLADAARGRQAGRFVWLELDFDKPVNQAFIARHGIGYTPTLLVFDPADERALAAHRGGISPGDLEQFLGEGESAFRGAARSPADTTLARADLLLSHNETDEAASVCRAALGLGGPAWPERAHAIRTLTWALMGTEACAETAAAEAPGLPRTAAFGAIVLAGLWSGNSGGDAPWAQRTMAILEPLGEEAIALPVVIRDHRYQIYQNLIGAARRRGDTTAVVRWGHRWLDDIEAIQPKDDDERSALDIARVDAASEIDEPERVLPALVASERAMPKNYNASLRHAQMAFAAKRYDESLDAIERGLAHVTGPLGRSWLLTTRANALDGKGDRVGARAALVDALAEARRIGHPALRENNVGRISRALEAYDRQAN